MLSFDLLVAEALAASRRTSTRSFVQTANLAATHATFRNGNGEWTKGSTKDSNAATSVFGSIQDIMVRIIQGGDLEFCVCVTSTAQLHQPAFSGLLDEQVRVIFQEIPFHLPRLVGVIEHKVMV